MTEVAQAFAEALNFIGALRTKEMVEASREQLGGETALAAALRTSVARCRVFLASAKAVDGIPTLAELGDALAMLDAVDEQSDDGAVAAAATKFLRHFGMP